jgi:hypothetical protein
MKEAAHWGAIALVRFFIFNQGNYIERETKIARTSRHFKNLHYLSILVVTHPAQFSFRHLSLQQSSLQQLSLQLLSLQQLSL